MRSFFEGGSRKNDVDKARDIQQINPCQTDPSKPIKAVNATVAVVPLPKNTIGIIFGQRTSEYLQHYNTYIVDSNGIVLDPQAVWDAPTDSSRFEISAVFPPLKGFAPDPNVLSVGPFDDDRHIGIYFSHKGPKDAEYQESVPQHTTHEFKITGKNAISFTMVNADDGSGKGFGFHDTVVGVAVVYTTK